MFDELGKPLQALSCLSQGIQIFAESETRVVFADIYVFLAVELGSRDE